MNYGETRIIGGVWKNRKITFPVSEELRPTLSRIKEDMFNWLMHDIHKASCLDLFAGSGSLGIEALSRGANHTTFVDKNPKLIKNIQDNLTKLKATPNSYNLYCGKFPLSVEKTNKCFDIVFLDPPYEKISINSILNTLFVNGNIHMSSKIIYETKNIDTISKEFKIIKNKSTKSLSYGAISLKNI